MKRSRLHLVSILLLLCVRPHVAAGSHLPPLEQAPIESASSCLPEATSGDDPSFPDSDLITPTDGIRIDRDPPLAHWYPRLSLGTNWVQVWSEKPEGLEFLYQFQEIYGPSTVEEVAVVRELAEADGHAAWADNTIWIQGECLVTTGEWTSAPPAWALGLARNNIPQAINIAVYMNGQHQVDWFLRDIHGEKMRIWSDAYYALNLSPDCPVGAWNGVITYEGQQYSLGDTRGLTLLQWLQGPFTEAVIRNSQFSEVFDGLEAEDYPSAWLYYFNGQIPDPKRDGVGFPDEEQFEAYCRNVWRSWFLDFLKPLQDRFIVRVNNHHTRWYFEHQQNPWPEVQQAATGCKLERYFGAGGWPSWDQPQWSAVYHAVEELYHPLNPDPTEPGLDGHQGWDMTTVQLNAPFDWPGERIDRYKRAGLASTLMGDGFYDGTAYAEDFYYTGYLRGGQTQYAPRDIPEMRIPLGRALGPSRYYRADQRRPLEYRWFRNEETGQFYTVVCNVWDVPVAGIPAQDGVWFRGRWPAGEYEQLNGNPAQDPRDTMEVSEDSEPPRVESNEGPGPLRVIPSVTPGRTRLGFSAPVSSPVEIRIHGVGGGVIRNLILAPGQRDVLWDGCDLDGRRVAAGLYFAHAGAQAGGPSARVLIVR